MARRFCGQRRETLREEMVRKRLGAAWRVGRCWGVLLVKEGRKRARRRRARIPLPPLSLSRSSILFLFRIALPSSSSENSPSSRWQRPGGACAPWRGSARLRAEDAKERDEGAPSRNTHSPLYPAPHSAVTTRAALLHLPSLRLHCPGLYDRPILFSASQRAALKPDVR